MSYIPPGLTQLILKSLFEIYFARYPVKEIIWIFQDKNYATKSGNILDNNGNIIGRANSWFKYNHNPSEKLRRLS